mgnify:FL=1
MLSLSLTLITFAIVDLLTGGLAATPQAKRWKRHVGVTFLLSLAAAGAYWLNAKSIIRFPELQSKGKVEGSGHKNGDGTGTAIPLIDELTEYFLMGSLLSWALALVAVLPIYWV